MEKMNALHEKDGTHQKNCDKTCFCKETKNPCTGSEQACFCRELFCFSGWSAAINMQPSLFEERLRTPQRGVSEKVYMLVSKAQMENAKNQLGNVSGVTLLECETDDAWARDVGATMVLDEKGAVCGKNTR